MGGRPVTWKYSRSVGDDAPAVDQGKIRRRPLGVRRMGRRRRAGYTADRRAPERGGNARRDRRPSAGSRNRAVTPACRSHYTLEGDVEDVSRQHIANRASITVHPAPWYVGVRRPALLPRTEERTRRRRSLPPDSTARPPQACRSRSRSRRCNGRACGAPKATASTRGTPKEEDASWVKWTVTTGATRCRSTSRSRAAATSSSKRAGREAGGRLRRDPDVVLCPWRRLHRLGALRSQPHRARPRASDLQAGRHRADHDPVAVGAGHGARDHRARRHPDPPAVRAHVHAAIDHGARSPRATSPTCSSPCCSSRAEPPRPPRRRARRSRGRAGTPRKTRATRASHRFALVTSS